MNKNITQWVVIGVVVVIIVAAIGAMAFQKMTPGQYDVLAKCIKDSGAKFYGAFWCPHCQDQKTAFGNSQKHLPYVECSTPDSNGQLEVCATAGINAYPTWVFADDTREEGELSLSALAEKTGCELPQ